MCIAVSSIFVFGNPLYQLRVRTRRISLFTDRSLLSLSPFPVVLSSWLDNQPLEDIIMLLRQFFIAC
jgi:hypothetical protein